MLLRHKCTNSHKDLESLYVHLGLEHQEEQIPIDFQQKRGSVDQMQNSSIKNSVKSLVF